jgi:predicted ATPase
MVTRFWARNLACFQEIAVDLEPFTVLVGRNASGKSTVLRGLRALALLTRMSLVYRGKPLRLTPGTSMLDLFGDPRESLTLGVDVRAADGHGTYSITLSRDPLRDRVEVSAERAVWQPQHGEAFRYDSSEEATQLEFEYRGSPVSSRVPRTASLPYLAYPYYQRQQEWTQRLEPLYKIVDGFAPFYVYRFSPASICVPVEPKATLSYDGGGLATELDRLLGVKRKTFDQIESQLKDLFPHIEQINIPTWEDPHRGSLKYLQFETTNGRKVHAEVESDGVLLSLAYLYLANEYRGGFAVEEPEAGAHPDLLRTRIQLLRSVAERGVQVVITTQSPVLLMGVGETKNIRVCEDGSVYEPPERSVLDVIYTRLNWTL